MIHNITITGGFAHQNSYFDFTSGLTGITGVNASGKSEILTSIRFALFGAGALRTQAEDYKGFKVKLEFTVKGTRYGVERTTTKATLHRAGEVIATGTRPVNQKIVSIFGYGLDVFDVANAANQGLIEALSTMRPSDRRKMVDQTIGLDVLDGLTKRAHEEAGARTKAIEELSSRLVAPVEPVRPEGWTDRACLETMKVILERQDGERRDVAHCLAQKPAEPVEVICQESRTLEELEGTQRRRGAVLIEIDRLRKEDKGIPDALWTEEQINAAELEWSNIAARANARLWLTTNLKPVFSESELYTMEDTRQRIASYDAWLKLKEAGHHECPKCQHRWPVNQTRMLDLGDWEGQDRPDFPALTTAQICVERGRNLHYEATLGKRAECELIVASAPATETNPIIAMNDITAARLALSHAARKAAIQESLTALTTELYTLPDVSQAIATRTAFDRAARAYAAALEHWNTWTTSEPAWTARLIELGDTAAILSQHLSLMVEVQTYDRLLVAYTSALEAYQDGLDRIGVLEAEARGWTAAKAALVELKLRIKTFLVPSLSRVASGIVNVMSAGNLTEIVVDEDFDITVDGKRIDGMSGAEKAATNLSLRIGLGQVLTNSVFSVFMADEIDAAMDDERAEATAQCLRNLTKSISQIVLVSHKEPVADQYIRL